jgi:hypothetical protein
MPITQNNLLEIVLRGIPDQLDLPDWDDWELPELEPMPELDIDLPPLEDLDFPNLDNINFQMDMDVEENEPCQVVEEVEETCTKRSTIFKDPILRIVPGSKA